MPAAVALFFVAPFVAEYLLGDLSLKLLPAMVLLAPMYGGGALLIREFARRKQRGWPTILLLGAAFTMLEEGLVTQSLFNPDYLRLHLHFLQPAHLAWLGIGGWWTMLMFNLHTFWSMGASIALVEGLVPERANEPWLGNVGEAVVGVLFGFGLVANAVFGFKQNRFVASHAQLATSAAFCVLLIAAVFVFPCRAEAKRDGGVPPAWIMGLAAFAGGLAIQMTPSLWGWGAVAMMLAVDVAFLAMVAALSRRSGWTLLHTLSLGAGAALEYGVHAFGMRPFGAGTRLLGWVGNAVLLAIAIALIVLAAKRTMTLVARGTAQV